MKNRLASLDILRGIAVLMVLVVHTPFPVVWNVRETFAFNFISLGAFGVDLFFVLSGFLISGLIFHEQNKNGEVRFVNFWLRRSFKILPAYYVAYSGGLILRAVVQHPNGFLNEVATLLSNEWSNFVFLQTYINPTHRWHASWSLAIEEHFYLVLPILLSILFLFRNKRLVPFTITLIALGVAANRFYAAWVADSAFDFDLIYIQTHFRADALCVGVILGWFSIYRKTVFARFAEWRSMIVPFFVIALLIPFFYPLRSRGAEMFGFFALSLFFGAVVAIAANVPDLWVSSENKFIRNAGSVLARIGFYSYSIYLSQAVMMMMPFAWIDGQIFARFGVAPGVGAIGFWVCSILFGVLLSHIIEQPALRLREKMVPKPAPLIKTETL